MSLQGLRCAGIGGGGGEWRKGGADHGAGVGDGNRGWGGFGGWGEELEGEVDKKAEDFGVAGGGGGWNRFWGSGGRCGGEHARHAAGDLCGGKTCEGCAGCGYIGVLSHPMGRGTLKGGGEGGDPGAELRDFALFLLL